MATYPDAQNILVCIWQAARVVAQAAYARHGTRVIIMQVEVEPRRLGEKVIHGASLFALIRLSREIAGTRVARGNLGRHACDVGFRGRVDVEVAPDFVHLLIRRQDFGDVVQVRANTKERNSRVALGSTVIAGVRLDTARHGGEHAGHVLTVLHAVSGRTVFAQWR